jgi:hypothetical protein
MIAVRGGIKGKLKRAELRVGRLGPLHFRRCGRDATPVASRGGLARNRGTRLVDKHAAAHDPLQIECG